MEYIIHEDYRGFGVWVSDPNWREYQPLEIFSTRQQAEEYEQKLLEHNRINKY